MSTDSQQDDGLFRPTSRLEADMYLYTASENTAQLTAGYTDIGIISQANSGSLRKDLEQILNGPRVFSGRTKSIVFRYYDPILNRFTMAKKTEDPILAEMEIELLQRFCEAGFSVPAYYGQGIPELGTLGNNFMRTSYVEGQTITHYVRNNLNTIHTSFFGGMESFDKFGTLLWRSILSGFQFDAKLQEILPDTYKTYINGEKLQPLKEKFNVSDAGLQSNYDVYRMMESLAIDPQDSAEFIRTLKPLQNGLTATRQKYGLWSITPSATNIIVENDINTSPIDADPNTSNLVFVDFNHISFVSQQEAIQYLLDAYLPITDSRSRIVINPNTQLPQTSAITEEEKIDWIKNIYVALSKNNPNKDLYGNNIQSFSEFMNGYIMSRVPFAIRQIGYAAEELKETMSFRRYYHLLGEIEHYRLLLEDSLFIMANNPAINPQVRAASTAMANSLLTNTAKYIQSKIDLKLADASVRFLECENAHIETFKQFGEIRYEPGIMAIRF